MSETVQPFLTREAIQKRIAEMATEIRRDSGPEDLHLICVLKGAVLFLSDLIRYM